VALPNIFLTHLFSIQRLKKKGFYEIGRLAWAKEVWSSNLDAPTKFFYRVTAPPCFCFLIPEDSRNLSRKPWQNSHQIMIAAQISWREYESYGDQANQRAAI
jgi:hypothetical protein